MKLVIICVEGRKKSPTDSIYVDKTIKTFYSVGNDTKIEFVYMEGKGNYSTVTKKFEPIKKRMRCADADVVYCIDTDGLNDRDAVVETDKIEKFCKTNGYDCVWFCEDVERVYLHKKVSDNDKADAARQFACADVLCEATESSLGASAKCRNKSNILKILDKHFNRVNRIKPE